MQKQVEQFLKQQGMYYADMDLSVECQKFIEEMKQGLNGEACTLDMLPTYLSVANKIDTNTPALVIDAGGTNFRVGCVTFDDAMQPQVSNFSKTQMPGIAKELSKKEFFSRMVDLTKKVAETTEQIGFCFSYPTEIDKDKDGTLLRWTKEVKVPEVVGERIGENLVAGLKEVDGRDRGIVILNDTVATLLGGKGITSHREFDGYIGFIFGTGTNACYIEETQNISKISDAKESTMIINMESGAYGKLPRGAVDVAFDAKTANPGDYQFEKMVSGRYLGPLLLDLLQVAAKEGLFSEGCNQALLALGSCGLIDLNTFMCNPHDRSNVIARCVQVETDCTLLYEIIDAMIERAAKACAITLSSIIIKTNTGLDSARPVGIIGEGTTFYKLKDFKEKLDYYMKAFLVKEHGRHYEFIKGEDLNLIGTAIAALSNK